MSVEIKCMWCSRMYAMIGYVSDAILHILERDFMSTRFLSHAFKAA